LNGVVIPFLRLLAVLRCLCKYIRIAAVQIKVPLARSTETNNTNPHPVESTLMPFEKCTFCSEEKCTAADLELCDFTGKYFKDPRCSAAEK
jgi:hypothetical protein